ncbi:hypothetical protein I552_0309 [Mycobacterium xenopi 3993]|nr:hypothetical protein I552_0309 [Mycobacterium xenopi 3993]
MRGVVDPGAAIRMICEAHVASFWWKSEGVRRCRSRVGRHQR